MERFKIVPKKSMEGKSYFKIFEYVTKDGCYIVLPGSYSLLKTAREEVENLLKGNKNDY